MSLATITPGIYVGHEVPAHQSSPQQYSSIDSTPVRYARKISPWKVPAMLAFFTAISTIQIVALRHTALNDIFPSGDYILGVAYAGTHAIGFRLFSLSFLFSFSVFWPDKWQRKLAMTIYTWSCYSLACLCLDAILYLLALSTDWKFSLNVAEILSGLMGFAIFSLLLLENGAMPPQISIRQRGRTAGSQKYLWVVGLLVVSSLVALVVERTEFATVGFLRSVALLGGIGPGVFLVLPIFFLFLFIFAHIRRMFINRSEFSPDISIIIPAFNEDYIIERTILALDQAAHDYRGRVYVFLVDNNSKDRTAHLATLAFERCARIKGRVIPEGSPGKSFALNRGLSLVQTDFVIRVDADTQLLPGSIARAMSWFSDSRVGVVGGLPLVPTTGPFDRARQVETLVKHGFYSIALEAVGGVIGVPGMFAVYRTRQLRALGGFVSGMNGEDTDISLRIAERGHRIVTDAGIAYVSEVPTTIPHMREQRLRWFRSVFHISSRGRQIILGAGRSIRGKVVLPYMLVNSARRAMMVPLVIFGAIEYFTGGGREGMLQWQSVVSVVLGVSVLIAVLASIVNRRPRALLGLPDYFLFRFLRSYFTLESMLTVIVLAQRRSFSLHAEP